MKTVLLCIATVMFGLTSVVGAEGAAIDKVDLPVPINGMKTDFLRCKSAEKHIPVDVTVALREDETGFHKLIVYAYDGTVFRFWEAKASRILEGRDVIHRSEWYHLEGGWSRIDPDVDPQSFWDSFARDHFGTTGNDLVEFDQCVLYQSDAS